jgi:hypothetical protein
VPEAVNVKIVLVLSVVTVGEPVDVPEYAVVGILKITTPEPPLPPVAPSLAPPPPDPVFTVPFVPFCTAP